MMKGVLLIARKEIQEGLRNRWVLANTLLLAALALTLTFLGSAPDAHLVAPGTEGLEERKPLDVVPMRVGEEKVGAQGMVLQLLHEVMSEPAESAPRIEDHEAGAAVRPLHPPLYARLLAGLGVRSPSPVRCREQGRRAGLV